METDLVECSQSNHPWSGSNLIFPLSGQPADHPCKYPHTHSQYYSIGSKRTKEVSQNVGRQIWTFPTEKNMISLTILAGNNHFV
jgi:hypothetical protein